MGDRSLETLQRFVADAVIRDPAVGQNAELLAGVERLVMPSRRGMSPAARLDIYREQFWLRHVPSLEEDYPTLSWAVGGSSRFRELAVDYLAANPPATWDLQKLGEGLPPYVANHAPWQDNLLAWDAARLDWAFMEAFDAPDAAPFDARALSMAKKDAWPLATVVFHPSVRAIALGHPAHELREALRNGSPPQRPALVRTPVVVWRDATCCLRAAAIEERAHELLVALGGGAPLGLACETVARAAGTQGELELGPMISSWFQHWTASGWVAAVRFAG